MLHLSTLQHITRRINEGTWNAMSVKEKQCWLCSKYFPTTDLNAHVEQCRSRYYQCPRCKKMKIPMEKKAEHRALCPKTVNCKQCQGSFKNQAMFNRHLPCRYWRCIRCRKRGIPIALKKQHLLTCALRRRCWYCRKLFPNCKAFDRHRPCNYWACRHCDKRRIPLSLRAEHQATCLYWKCHNCDGRIYAATGMNKHEPKCALEYFHCNKCKKRKFPPESAWNIWKPAISIHAQAVGSASMKRKS